MSLLVSWSPKGMPNYNPNIYLRDVMVISLKPTTSSMELLCVLT